MRGLKRDQTAASRSAIMPSFRTCAVATTNSGWMPCQGSGSLRPSMNSHSRSEWRLSPESVDRARRSAMQQSQFLGTHTSDWIFRHPQVWNNNGAARRQVHRQYRSVPK
jgi:hypothetical protein